MAYFACTKFTERLLLRGLEIRLIGQAKHRSADRKVGEAEVNAFITQYRCFITGKGRGQKVVPDWFKRLKSPIIAMFITNSEFTQGAYNVGKEEGIILKDGEQIAEDLLHSPFTSAVRMDFLP